MDTLDLKSTISKIKDSAHECNSIIEGTGGRSSGFKDRMIANIQSEQQKNTDKKTTKTKTNKKQSLRELWDHNKISNIYIIRGSKGEEEEDKDERLPNK